MMRGLESITCEERLEAGLSEIESREFTISPPRHGRLSGESCSAVHLEQDMKKQDSFVTVKESEGNFLALAI